ncbi:MAG: DUF493 domain-containing protein [Rhodothermia bacterium]|nr:MAG: DUF493 domain-containing protein [Rhodothermia bacterium]
MAIEATQKPDDSTALDEWWTNFRLLLANQSDWPTDYLYKFIVPKAGLEALKNVFGDARIIVRASKRGKYLSVTSRMPANSPDEVIAVYKDAGKIDGVISL